ncbi:MAG: pseudouridine synthase [Candidatus Margulisbacteria bacterium]|nr:pseudouridine synthase [Candidatus Margulisiibacteriota bacterium]
MPQDKQVRLQKHMAECGIASRRKAELLIRAGKVRVNGQVVTQLGTKIDPQVDKVVVEDRTVGKKEKKIYIKLNKPRGIVSACEDERERTVIDLVKDIPYRLYPVGRLDKDSEGLMILTNDGELADRLMHPRYEHEKEYEVTVKYPVSAQLLVSMQKGIELDGEKTLPAKIVLEEARKFRIILKEGKNRQIRRMVETMGNRVVQLKRIRVKNIRLGELLPGQHEYLSSGEIKGLTGL